MWGWHTLIAVIWKKTAMLGEDVDEMEHMPMILTLIGGGTKPGLIGNYFEATTTFEEATRIIEQLRREGIHQITVVYEGWQASGTRYTDERFPIPQQLGGEQALEQFAARMEAYGIEVFLQDFVGWKKPQHSNFSIKGDGIRRIDSTVLLEDDKLDGHVPMSGSGVMDVLESNTTSEQQRFIPTLQTVIQSQQEVIEKFKSLGVDGVYYEDGPGNMRFSNFHATHRLTRGDTAAYYASLLDYTEEHLGSVAVFRGFDDVLSNVDVVQELPLTSSHDLLIDETVPFYPIALHGAVLYTGVPGNMRSEEITEKLRALEYGAIPSFVVTATPSRLLQHTDYAYIYSSEFAMWKQQIVDEYADFQLLANVVHQRIIDHEKLAEGVYRTTYEDGTTVTVDYMSGQYVVEGGSMP